jgi:hypothetical protein
MIQAQHFTEAIQTLDQPLTVETKPRKKIGFTVKEKQARYGKQSNR